MTIEPDDLEAQARRVLEEVYGWHLEYDIPPTIRAELLTALTAWARRLLVDRGRDAVSATVDQFSAAVRAFSPHPNQWEQTWPPEDVLRRLLAESRAGALNDVATERKRQDAKYGRADFADGRGHDVLLPVLTEEVGEVARCLNDHVRGGRGEPDPVHLREELIQVAAVAVKWAEWMDARAAEAEPGAQTKGSGS